MTPENDCKHDPRYSRSECAACGHQVAWCARCEVDLCGCPSLDIPPGNTGTSEAGDPS